MCIYSRNFCPLGPSTLRESLKTHPVPNSFCMSLSHNPQVKLQITYQFFIVITSNTVAETQESLHKYVQYVCIVEYIYLTGTGFAKRWRKKFQVYIFFHSFIGYSFCNIQYKFIIQHTKKKRKGTRSNQKPKRGRCNVTNVPCEAPPLD